MNCEVCGTELPHGAMFCGECGRAVGTRAAMPVHPDSGMPIAASAVGEPNASGAHRAEPSVAVAQRDTVILEPIKPSYPEVDPQPEPRPAPTSTTEPDLPAGPEPSTEPDEMPQPGVEQDLPPEVIEGELAESSAPSARPRPDPFPWGDRGSKVFVDSDEIEQTLIVERRETGARFVLQFSTGESVTVYGNGLLGRNPVPQPTEYFDQLVTITDPGKSVSKTHLEFGQDSGAFWVLDRFSGNGSVVREPDSAPRRLVPGKRYRIVRGTRVDIGEQFFVVS